MKRSSGFTLIELLVVIAIIAILAAILFPVFTAAKERGRMTQCLSNLRSLSVAILQYADDNNGRLPKVWPMNLGDVANTPANIPDWCGSTYYPLGYPARSAKLPDPRIGSIWQYSRSKGVYLCPTDIGTPATGYPGSPTNYPESYAMNDHLDRKKLDSANNRRSRILLLIHDARTLAVQDSMDDGHDDGKFSWAVGIVWNMPSGIHYDGTTVSYLDGHAACRGAKALVAEKESGAWRYDLKLSEQDNTYLIWW